MDKESLINLLEGTELGKRIENTGKIYADLNDAEDRFCNSFDIHCTAGCGTCCEHFTPDITKAEAEFLAFGIIAENREQEIAERFEKHPQGEIMCPLYNKDTPFHCSVYAYRPLICRLFGATASNDKEGKPVFRRCKWNTRGKEKLAEEDFATHPEDVVTMREYGIRIDEGNLGEPNTEMLDVALNRALSEINFICEMRQNEEK